MPSLPAWSSRAAGRLLIVLLAVLAAQGATGADAVTASGAEATATTTPAGTPDRLRYDVSLRGNADGSRWRGRQRVSLRNSSDRPLREVYVRLWGNGVDECGAPGAPSDAPRQARSQPDAERRAPSAGQ
ncbi:hypothetical protein ACFQ6E_18975 [Streptomyces sp. NPDC056462]|uniref:hypothetical protein n=1 Tax=Streptomyces sp. NPDC056462 TaxID=3345826 RepID=UPI0036846DD9